MSITQEQVEEYKLRTLSDKVKSFMFKVEKNPGVLKFITIEIGKKYRINRSDLKINNRIFEVLNFIYRLKSDIETSTPEGIEVKFLDNNKKGTYYDFGDLEEV
jgi:hypothetical protein